MLVALESILGRVSEAINQVSKIVLGIIVLSMFSSLMLQVISRYVFNNPLPWPEELTTFLMAWMSFVGAAVALKHWEHIGVDILINKVHGKVRWLLMFTIRICVLVFVIYLIKAGITLVQDSTSLLSDGMRISMVYPRLSMPVGGLLMFVHLTHMIVRDILQLKEEGEV